IARAHGYGRIPGRLPTPVLPPFRPDPSGARHAVRRIAAGLGPDEILSHALLSADDLRRPGYDPGVAHLVRVANPISDLHAIMRPTLAPSLLGALAENVGMRRPDPWLFEVGKTYHYQPDAPLRPGMESAGT